MPMLDLVLPLVGWKRSLRAGMQRLPCREGRNAQGTHSMLCREAVPHGRNEHGRSLCRVGCDVRIGVEGVYHLRYAQQGLAAFGGGRQRRGICACVAQLVLVCAGQNGGGGIAAVHGHVGILAIVRPPLEVSRIQRVVDFIWIHNVICRHEVQGDVGFGTVKLSNRVQPFETTSLCVDGST